MCSSFDPGPARLSEEPVHDAALYRLLVDSVRDCAIFTLDPHGYILTWNAGAERCKGYTSQEAIGRHYSMFYPPERLAARFPHYQLEVAAREGRYEDEGWRIRKDGSRFWANVLITPLRNEAGDVIAFAKITRDLTERRNAHERAIEDARRLEAEEIGRRHAEERAQELRALADELHRQAVELERRGQEAEEANRAKSEFLAAMSHELRTPLNAIAGYAELIATGCSGPVTELQKQQLERIQWSQQHLLGIINNILNFTRVEAGTLTYTLADVSVREIASECAALIAPQGEAKGIAIDVQLDEGLRVVADRAKLQQILLNLLSNALKFTPNDGRVTIAARDEGARVAIEVRDTGIGIPADKREAIFEPFVQLDRSLINIVDGTGLGLAISRDLARAMDGDLDVDSELGGGSTFVLMLPAAPSRA